MPSGNTGVKYAGSGSGAGWTSPGSIVGNDGSYATGNYLVTNEGGGVFGYDETTTLTAGSFGAGVPGTPVGILVEIEAKRAGAPNPVVLSVQLTKSGVVTGIEKGAALNTVDTVHSFGGSTDLWGGSWAVADGANIGVHVWATPGGVAAGSGTVSVDFVRITIYYEQPTAFSFTDLTNQALSTTVQSNAITISGITGPASASVTGGEWNKNGGAFTSSAGTVVAGDLVRVRHTTAGGFGQTVNTIFSAGGAADTFSSTTTTSDTTPNAFGFTTKNGAEPSTSYDSNSVAITGINTATAISVTNGSYSKNGGAFTTAAGTVNPNDTIVARGTANAAFDGVKIVTVTVGGVAGTYTINTRSADTVPNDYAWTPQSGVAGSTLRTSNLVTILGLEAATNVTFSNETNGTVVAPAATAYEVSINGAAFVAATGTKSISNNQTIQVRVGSNAGAGVAATMTTNIGGVARTFTVTTTTGDTTPDQFTFTDEPSAAVGQSIDSSAVTISGIDAAAAVSFATGGIGSGHQYRKFTAGAWGAWTALGATTVVNGDQLQLRMTAPTVIGDAASITPTVGGVSDTWDVTAAAPDEIPLPFEFNDVGGADTLTSTVSNAITVGGINAAAPISISGADGEYRVNGGAWGSTAGTVVKGDTVEVRVTSAGTLSTTVNTVLEIGGVNDTFSVTTRSPNLASQYVVTFREIVYAADA
jgi:hypothetical protein